MSQILFLPLWKALSAGALVGVGLLLAVPNGPARAGPILDPLGDFLPTYAGPQDSGLDVVAHEVTLVGDRLNFFGRMAGPIAPTQAVGGLYLIGVDRGLGTPRFLNSPAAPPTIGPNVKWDAIVRILPNGTAFFLNSLLGVTTPISTSDISIIGNEFNVSIPVSLMLPSATKPPEEWTYNLWPRNGVGLNVQVSDLAPDDGNSPVHVVPEPASLTLCGIVALGLFGRRWRGRRRAAREVMTHRQSKERSVTKHWAVVVTASLGTLLALLTPNPRARADIFKWEYINPANPALGKQQSTTLTPGGAGAIAAPGADLSNRNLTKAYLIGANLTGVYAHSANLTNAELSQADLTNAGFFVTALTNANLTGSEVRGASFYDTGITMAQLYSTASYQAHDLTGIGLRVANLAGANFVGQNLTNADFFGANLTGASLTGAVVRGADFAHFDEYFGASGGLSLAQIYSTASYQAHDLTGIGLYDNDLTGANLAGQNLTNADFGRSKLINANLSQANLTNADFYIGDLTGANLTGAVVRGANLLYTGLKAAQLYSTASYEAHDLTGIRLAYTDLTGGNLAGQNLTNAYLDNATVNHADLSQANLTNAGFRYTTFVNANLSQANLTNAYLSGVTFTNANFSQANLTNAVFYVDYYSSVDLTGANLSQANLTNASFSGYSYPEYDEWGWYLGDIIVPGANLTVANLSGADARGASFDLATLTGANTSNLIQSDGHIAGVNLTSGALLIVRDYDGNPAAASPTGPLPIVVDQHLAMDGAGTLRLVFDADAWDSTISFAPGIAVGRGGTLELLFAPDVNPASQLGRTIDLFNWAGVAPTGAFTISSPYTWNLSQLYTTGEVTLTGAAGGVLGDFNGDSVVDADDLASWKMGFGTSGNATLAQGDADGDKDVDGADFLAWQRQVGGPTIVAGTEAVPEPATLLLLVSGVPAMCFRRRVAAVS